MLDELRTHREELFDKNRRLEDLHGEVEAARARYAELFERQRVRFSAELGARRSRVHGDSFRLDQILSSLVANALRNTPPAGEVVVANANIADDVRVIVRDTGVGIEHGLLRENLFTILEGRQPFTGETERGPRGRQGARRRSRRKDPGVPRRQRARSRVRRRVSVRAGDAAARRVPAQRAVSPAAPAA